MCGRGWVHGRQLGQPEIFIDIIGYQTAIVQVVLIMLRGGFRREGSGLGRAVSEVNGHRRDQVIHERRFIIRGRRRQ